MSKYADIEQIKKVIRTEWVKYIPMELDVNLSFVLGKISEVPTIEIVHCKECKYADKCSRNVAMQDTYQMYEKIDFCSYGERIEE